MFMAKAKEATTGSTIKYFPDQFDDEEVLYVFRKHPIVMRRGIIWGSLALLVGPVYTLILTYIHESDGNIPSMNFFYVSFLASMLLSAVLFFPSWMSWYYSVFVVTDQRFMQITQRGFFHHSVVDMSLSQIQMVNYEVSGMTETLLGYGTIMMQTFVGDLVIHYLHKPQHIQKKILEILREHGVSASASPVNQ